MFGLTHVDLVAYVAGYGIYYVSCVAGVVTFCGDCSHVLGVDVVSGVEIFGVEVAFVIGAGLRGAFICGDL